MRQVIFEVYKFEELSFYGRQYAYREIEGLALGGLEDRRLQLSDEEYEKERELILSHENFLDMINNNKYEFLKSGILACRNGVNLE